jgi:DNA-binding NtrC family response regulator
MSQHGKPQVLICDDDSLYHMALKAALKGRFECRSAYNTDEAMVILKNHAIDVLLLDVHMRTPQEGLEALPKIRELDPDLSVLMISGTTEFEVVREAMRLGAIDYIPKDFNPDDLRHTLEQALERNQLLKRREQQNFEVTAEQKKHVLIGESAQIQSLRKTVDKFRQSSANVLIYGETGTGKEVVARHLRGTLPDGSLAPFVAIDSATIQSSMAESILFGYEKGAFTGADRSNKGVFEEANGGIVYFDELGNMPLEIQAKLLRVLQEKEVTRLGSTKSIQLDFRVVCATNRDLDQMVTDGQFKGDLLQRLNVLPVNLPPLKERKEDIPLLIAHFLKKEEKLRGTLQITPEAEALLKNYSWPGNIRELTNVIAFTVTMAEQPIIDISDLPPKLRDLARHADKSVPAPESGRKFYDQVAEFEKKILHQAYATAENNISKLALSLGMDRSHLYTKLREYGIHSGRAKH